VLTRNITWKKKADVRREIGLFKFCDSNNLEKQEQNYLYEEKGSRKKRFRKPEQSDSDETLLK
jgi:hypothetical protein